MNTTITEPEAQCGARCPHALDGHPEVTLSCHLAPGHEGSHVSLGPSTPGRRPGTVCSWKGTR